MISAIFLLVVVAMLGAMMVTLSNTEQLGQARDLFGSNARSAARAGIEYALYQVERNGVCASNSPLPALSGSAMGFTVQVQCTAYGPYQEDMTNITIYQLIATTTRGTLGQLDYVERQMTAQVSVP